MKLSSTFSVRNCKITHSCGICSHPTYIFGLFKIRISISNYTKNRGPFRIARNSACPDHEIMTFHHNDEANINLRCEIKIPFNFAACINPFVKCSRSLSICSICCVLTNLLITVRKCLFCFIVVDISICIKYRQITKCISPFICFCI